MAFASLSSSVARMHLAQDNPQVTFLGEEILLDGIGCFCICFSAFTETGVTQTRQTSTIWSHGFVCQTKKVNACGHIPVHDFKQWRIL